MLIIIRCLFPFSLSNIHLFVFSFIFFFEFGRGTSKHTQLCEKKITIHSIISTSGIILIYGLKKSTGTSQCHYVCAACLNYQFYSHPRSFVCALRYIKKNQIDKTKKYPQTQSRKKLSTT